MLYLALIIGPFGLLFAPILGLGAIWLLAGFLGRTFGKLMRRGRASRDDDA